jgi:D-alanyl-lipoteichoic acid acyltransferase DltB (MBOAT superfamily)
VLYNTKEFAIFFILVFLGYIVLKKEYRKFLLITTSYYFYAHFDVFLLTLLFIVSSICYLSSIVINKLQKLKNTFFVISLFIIFCPLFYFKYLNFILESCNLALSTNFSIKEIILPIGISFFTFQAAGYLIDVYRKKIDPAQNLFDFLLFISFFPQLVAGPIERASHLLPQLKKLEFKFEYYEFTSALKLIAWGFFKKIVIADKIAKLINPVYSNPSDFNSATLLLAIFLFGYQIYCDFSGYSDIAKGLAKLFGIDLMVNFKQPYLSKSIIEFWKRWHISLSTWFKDYLYIPLGGSQVNTVKFVRNIFLVFAISGIWHGANWTFLVWGIIHFVFYIAAKYIDLSSFKIHDSIKIFSTFIIANLAWVFFRSDSLETSFTILGRIFTNYGGLNIQYDLISLLVTISMILILEILSFKTTEYGYPQILNTANSFIRNLLYFILIMIIITIGEFQGSSFIYFQF